MQIIKIILGKLLLIYSTFSSLLINSESISKETWLVSSSLIAEKIASISFSVILNCAFKSFETLCIKHCINYIKNKKKTFQKL